MLMTLMHAGAHAHLHAGDWLVLAMMFVAGAVVIARQRS